MTAPVATLTQLRQSLDLSCIELANRAQMRPSELSAIETGKGFPSAHHLQKLAAALGLTIDQVQVAVRAGREQAAAPQGPTVTISCGPSGRGKITRTP